MQGRSKNTDSRTHTGSSGHRSKFPGKVASVDRDIALEHVGGRVARDGTEFQHVQAQLNESGQGIVPKIVEGEIIDASPRYSTFIGLLQGLDSDREYLTIKATG